MAIFQEQTNFCRPSCSGRHELAVGEQVKIILDQPLKNPEWPPFVVAEVVQVDHIPFGRVYSYQFDETKFQTTGGLILFEGCDVADIVCWTCCDIINECPTFYASLPDIPAEAFLAPATPTLVEALAWLATYTETLVPGSRVGFMGTQDDPDYLFQRCNLGHTITKKPAPTFTPFDPCATVHRTARNVDALSQFVDFPIPSGFTVEHIITSVVVRLVDGVNALGIDDVRDLGDGNIRVYLDGSPNNADTHRVLLVFDRTCPTTLLPTGGGNNDPVIIAQYCIGPDQVTEYQDGSVTVDQNAAACGAAAPGVPCAGQLCVNIEANQIYFFRNAGGATLNDLLTPGSPEYATFQGTSTDLILQSFQGDPRTPNDPAGNNPHPLDTFYPSQGDAFLSLPVRWEEIGVTGDAGAAVIGEWFDIQSRGKTGQLCLPASIEYYGKRAAITSDPNDPTTYANLPWNTADPVSGDINCT